jgi:hypothetical protein
VRSSAATNNNALNQRPNFKSKRPNCCRATAASCRRSLHYSQIPIARHRCSCPISRGFLPWRLSDDGPGACRVAHNGAVVRNPSQKETNGSAANTTASDMTLSWQTIRAPATQKVPHKWGSRRVRGNKSRRLPPDFGHQPICLCYPVSLGADAHAGTSLHARTGPPPNAGARVCS